MNSRETLRRRLEAAFADVPYPGDGNIAPHECGECAGMRKALQGTHWRDWVEKPVMEVRRQAELPLLSAEALRFFLPAFLMAVLRDPDGAQWIFEQFLYALDPEETKRPKRMLEFLKLLSEEQRAALLSFIDWAAAEIPEYTLPERLEAARATLQAAGG